MIETYYLKYIWKIMLILMLNDIFPSLPIVITIVLMELLSNKFNILKVL